MESNQRATRNKIARMRHHFISALERCEMIWGEYAFKRPEGNGWRDQLLAGMYDAQMISSAQISDDEYEQAASNSDQIIEKTRALFDDDEFDKSVRTGTNTPARIVYRVDQMRAVLQSV